MKDDLVERCARAILKSRFYDCEPQMYGSLDAFFETIDAEHFHDARSEAADALAIAIPAILEEAAAAAERYEGKPCGPAQLWTEEQRQFFDAGQMGASSSIATAIRSLSTTGER